MKTTTTVCDMCGVSQKERPATNTSRPWMHTVVQSNTSYNGYYEFDICPKCMDPGGTVMRFRLRAYNYGLSFDLEK